VALTAAGEVFLDEARNVLETYDRAESIGRVEIGCGLRRLCGRAPGRNVDVNAREFPMDQLPTLVCDGHVDIGFVRLPMTLPRALKIHVLLRDYFCLIGPVRPNRVAKCIHHAGAQGWHLRGCSAR
jgi:DNA-binding transcriptional LysR family regulator